MSNKKWSGTGGLWFNQQITKASDSRPRWKGSYTCTCGQKNTIVGYGSDQFKGGPNAPTIRLKVNHER